MIGGVKVRKNISFKATTIGIINEWRRKQRDIPNFSKAVENLILIGAATEDENGKFIETNSEEKVEEAED
jgi:hypothetical protein